MVYATAQDLCSEPDEGGTNISWYMLHVVDNDRLLGSSRHENFCCFVVIAEATLVERALDATANCM